MTDAGPGLDAAAFCAALVREHDFDRYAVTLFLAPALRRPLLALLAFNAEIGRVRDQVTQPLPGEVRLQWWRDALTGEAHGGAEGNPIAAELLAAVREHSLPVEPLTRLIDEHVFDLYNDPMPSVAALHGYLDATEGALFALAARLVTPSSPEIDHLAHHAALAVGHVRVMAALPRDSARGQLFLPAELLERHGTGAAAVFIGKATPEIRAALDEFGQDARQHLDAALELLPAAPEGLRPLFLPLALARRDLGRPPARDPFQPQPRSHLATLWTLWRASRTPAFSG